MRYLFFTNQASLWKHFLLLIFVAGLTNFSLTQLKAQTETMALSKIVVNCDLEIALNGVTNFCDGSEVCFIIENGVLPLTILLEGETILPTVDALNFCVDGLQPGTYVVTVTDAEGCTATLEVAIPFVDYYLDVNITDVSCFGGSDGAIQPVILIDPILFFHWEGPDGFTADTESISGLEAGDYSLSITWSDGSCHFTGGWHVAEPDPINIEVALDYPDCGQPDGCVFVNGGTAPYYIWVFDVLPAAFANSPNGMLADWTDLDPASGVAYDPTTIADPAFCAEDVANGTYYILVVDSHLCYAWQVVVIDVVPPFDRTLIATPAGCNGQGGSVCYQIEGGEPPYATWLEPSVTDEVLYGSEGCFDGLSAGEYKIITEDAAGCVVSEAVIISSTGNLEAHFEITNNDCGSYVDGCLTVSGGTMPYHIWVWTWNGPLTVIPTVQFDDNGNPYVVGTEPTDVFDWGPVISPTDEFVRCAENIPPGVYYVLVVDATGCYVLLPVWIPEPVSIESNLEFDQYGAYACVTPEGGTPPYSIKWFLLGSNLTWTGECIYDLQEGAYLVHIMDENGCATEDIFFIDEPVCTGGVATVNPDEIESGAYTVFTLENYAGTSIQWQFKTEIIDWVNIPGATESVYVTPPIHSGSDKLILVRAVVGCLGEDYFSSVADLKVHGNDMLSPLAADLEDLHLFDINFRKAELEAIPNMNYAMSSVDVYPTVCDNSLNIHFKGEMEGGTLIQVFNTVGERVYYKTISEIYEGTVSEVPTDLLNNGIYFISIQNNVDTTVKRIIVEH